ncbi:DUF4388 domain-containing protein [Deinococcus lacus]|uniref:DUF4388 domain-containing protein n=1 Tax=Deinococcus lacus TaxID=392561 RepID=A0ABW1YE95_9DEIO
MLREIQVESQDLPGLGQVTAHLSGEFHEFNLAELLGWVAEMSHSGYWTAEVKGDLAYMVMDRGDVAYVEFEGETGRPALLNLMNRTELSPESTFQFVRTELAPAVPRNIEERTERLLMEVTVDLDHIRANH